VYNLRVGLSFLHDGKPCSGGFGWPLSRVGPGKEEGRKVAMRRDHRQFCRSSANRTEKNIGEESQSIPVGGDQQVAEERLLAEIRHELGNFFHKLYYWAEFIREDTGGGADSTAAEMLERTIGDFEEFIRVTLEYFSPVRLSFVRVSVSQLLDSLVGAGGCERVSPEVGVSGKATAEDATLLVDPGYISRAFAITFARMRGQFKDDSPLALSVKPANRNGFSGFEVSISTDHRHPSSLLLRPAAAGVQWAVARKLFEMHGGEMVEEKENRGQVQAVSVFLPVYH